ncbi:cytochrome c peroxidase, partial [Phakopsora pachyrhizi]
ASSTSSENKSPPPPPPPPKSSKTALYGALGFGTLALAFYFYSVDSESDPSKLYAIPKAANLNLDYQKIYNEIAELLDNNDYDDGSYAPVLLRLAWHASGTYDKESKTGGSNGATMRFAPESDHGANAGLAVARDLLEPIYKKYASKGLTYSDLWTLAGVTAVQEIGGPKIPWRPGRQDGLSAQSCTPDGRLPDGDKDQDHIRKIFYRMGFNDQEIVALSGAHALGRCHPDRSGFVGPWTFSPTTFTNDYFKLLFDEKWQPKKWSGPPQYEDKKTKSLMMLTTDMSLIMDKKFREWAKKYADDEQMFFADFSKAFAKLIELGVPEENFGGKQPFILKKSDE